MVAGDEHCQLRAAIEVLVPYSYRFGKHHVAPNSGSAKISIEEGLADGAASCYIYASS
jgi:hypothetical protein